MYYLTMYHIISYRFEGTAGRHGNLYVRCTITGTPRREIQNTQNTTDFFSKESNIIFDVSPASPRRTSSSAQHKTKRKITKSLNN